jgi:hypothetical protein
MRKKKLREGETSLDQAQNLVWDAVKGRFGEESSVYVHRTFPDYVIIDIAGKYYKLGYSIDENNNVSLGDDMTPVEMQYVEITEAFGQLINLVEAADKDKQGWEWDVVIIESGASGNGFYYPPGVLREAVPLFEGVRALARADEKHIQDVDKSVKNIVGWFTNPRFENNRILARFHISGAADWLRTLMLDAWSRGKKDIVGFSIVAAGIAKNKRQGGKFVRFVEAIKQIDLVDVVVNPAAGGRIVRLAAAEGQNTEKELETMNKLWKLIESKRPDLLKGLDPEKVTEEELLLKLAEAITQPGDQTGEQGHQETEELLAEIKKLVEAKKPDSGEGQARDDETLERLERAEIALCEATLTARLTEAKLPELAAARIRKLFSGKRFEVADLDTAIKEEKEYLAKLTESRGSLGLGLPRMEVGMGSLEQLQHAFDRLFGLEVPSGAQNLPRLKGLREAYILMSGDVEITGRFTPGRGLTRLAEAFDSSTFSYILGNTLHRRMVKDYAAVEYHERKIMTVRPGVSDFKSQEAVREGYFGDINDVDPETADYQEISSYGDEEVTYSVGQKGNLVTITRKHIKNDDLGRVKKKISRLGRAARRTFARFVWNFIINNSTYGVDSKAFFHLDHGNLGSTALGVTALHAAAEALAKMTEPGSSERLGWPSEKFNLFIPVELRGTAIQTVDTPNLPGGSNNDKNPVYQIADIHIVPLFTDDNDWVLACPSVDRDIIEVAFMDGNEEPEFFIADNPTVGEMFKADKLQYKIRHEYGGAIVDYRGAYKAVVA